MIKEVLFVTNNNNKIKEIKSSINNNEFKILTLNDINLNQEIPEPFNTIKENAEAKVDFVFNKVKIPIFAEDTGLEIYCLHGEPGVKSARYAGNECNNKNNINKVLLKMSGLHTRAARFKTVLCYLYKNKKYFFEGICEGDILEKEQGENGFGYDAIFVPKGAKKSFAEMDLEEKKLYSHREKAIRLWIDFLKNQNK